MAAALPSPWSTTIATLGEQLLDLAVGKTKLNLEQFAICVIRDLQRIGYSVDKLDEQFASVRVRNLLIQGAVEARTSTTHERTERLARVVVSGMVNSNDPEDLVTEFLRMSSALAATDVFCLRIAAQIQAPASHPVENIELEEKRRNERRMELYGDWPKILEELKSESLSYMSVRSAFVRLQALGLADPVAGGFDAGDPTYEILELGRLYLAYLYDLDRRRAESGDGMRA